MRTPRTIDAGFDMLELVTMGATIGDARREGANPALRSTAFGIEGESNAR